MRHHNFRSMARSGGLAHFIDWLAELRVSLDLRTYHAGKVFFVNRVLDISIAVFERRLNRCMGCGRRLTPGHVVNSKFQAWRSA